MFRSCTTRAGSTRMAGAGPTEAVAVGAEGPRISRAGTGRQAVRARAGFDCGNQTNRTTWNLALAVRLKQTAGQVTFRQIARVTGTNPETTRRYMRSGCPSAQFIARFAEAFRVSTDWLLLGVRSSQIEAAPLKSKGEAGSAVESLKEVVARAGERSRSARRGVLSRPTRAAPRRAASGGGRPRRR
jgi:transcriptional regulator with XRE-family HTH domain